MGRLAVLACLLLAAALPAEVAVAHDSVPADQIDAQNLRNVLLGRVTVWSNGVPVVLVLSREDDRAVDAIAGRDLNRLLRGWKRLAFSGNGRMPTVEDDRAASIDEVAATRGAVVVLKLPDDAELPIGLQRVALR